VRPRIESNRFESATSERKKVEATGTLVIATARRYELPLNLANIETDE
jgi:hypothetical protein